jgi:hypothetical protein
MKTNTFLASICAASTLVSAAQAQTDIYLTGSTAFRAETHAGIRAKLNAGYTFAYTGSSIDSAAQAVFRGTIGTDAVNIYVGWTGSVAGQKSLTVTTIAGTDYTAAVRPSFLPPSTATSTTGTASTPVGTTRATADIAFTDNLQASTPFSVAKGYPALSEAKVGVIPFRFVSSYSVGGFPNPITNMTPLAAQLLYTNGDIPAALLTGNPADQGTFIYATGRDPDSGTRVITLAETGHGALSSVVHYRPTIVGTAVTTHAPFPAVPINASNGLGLPSGWGVGNSGQSGSATADILRCTTSAIGGFYVAGIGGTDVDRAVNGVGTTAGAGNAKELTWNGVAYSFNNVAEGRYTFWGYEYICTRASLGAATPQKRVANALVDYFVNLPATPLANQATALTLTLSDMKVVRTDDGGIVTPDY